MYLDFGTAASPVVHEGRVFVVHDNEAESFVAALDAKTGRSHLETEARPARGAAGRLRLVHAVRLGNTRAGPRS